MIELMKVQSVGVAGRAEVLEMCVVLIGLRLHAST